MPSSHCRREVRTRLRAQVRLHPHPNPQLPRRGLPCSLVLNTVVAAALVILLAAYLLGVALIYLHVTPGAPRRLAA